METQTPPAVLSTFTPAVDRTETPKRPTIENMSNLKEIVV